MPSELILESQGGYPSLPEETLSLRSTQVDDFSKITSATGLEFPPQFAKKDARAFLRNSCSPPPVARWIPESADRATRRALSC